MLNSIVTFLSAASALATKLEQNYLLDTVTQIRKPAFPLLCAPPQVKEESDGFKARLNNSEADSSPVTIEEISVSYPESKYHCEPSDLPQERGFINTEDKGDSTNATLPKEPNAFSSEVEQEVIEKEVPSIEVQQEKTIKICNSEDIIYFEDLTNHGNIIDLKSTTKPHTIKKPEPIFHSTSYVEDKCVQVTRTNCDSLSKSCKFKVKSIRSEEIQTHSTSRYKDTVRALITKSHELQKPIKDSIISPGPSTDIRCKHNAVPKNLHELKEQLNSIKKVSAHKIVVAEDRVDKGRPQTCCRVARDKKTVRNEKVSTNYPNANTFSNVPLKSPGTSKRFGTIESVVKKLIHTTRAVEKKEEEAKSNPKMCASTQRNARRQVIPQEKPEECKHPVKSNWECTNEKKEYPVKEFKYVKNHQDFIYRKCVAQKSEKTKIINAQSKCCAKREISCKRNEGHQTK